MSTTTAAAIRKDLKAAGIPTRAVSVRAPRGCGIYVDVKDSGVRLSVVRGIAKAHEDIRFCERTLDVLGGTFVRVDYSESATKPLESEILAAMSGVGERGQWASFRGIEISLSECGDPNMWEAYGPGVRLSCYGAEDCARQVAVAILDGAGACTRHTDCAEHVELGVACAESQIAA
jgi:hypothetical protein